MKIEIPFSDYNIVSPSLPVYLISTMDKNGVRNIAPYGMVMPVSYHPLIFAIGSDKTRDTYRNIKETGEFVLNLPSGELIDKLRITGIKFPPQIDEFTKAGLTPLPSLKVSPPSIKECNAHIECRLKDIFEVSEERGIIVGVPLCIRVTRELYIKNLPRQKGLLNPIFYVGGSYFSLGRYVGGRAKFLVEE
jgi:flavin reductase (DIM6/NTAB) family NADH-FMN oxidoreductase RutF